MAKPGPKPAPTAIKIQNNVRPARINKKEPKFKGLAEAPPDWLTDVVAIQEWRRVFPHLKAVCKVVDLAALAGYCDSFSEYQTSLRLARENPSRTVMTPNGAEQQCPCVAMARNWMNLMLKFAVELGMTPSSRGRVTDNGDEEDPLMNHMMKQYRGTVPGSEANRS